MWWPPAVTAVASVIPVTVTGVEELVVVPLPSCPVPLSPQQLTVPPPERAQVWSPRRR